ncbi:hypothetical protein Dsin_004559 [Dipteronia sinensis]|uniref:Uncharacterized protein n=1 Tax=Dipteronia sinensis TaxID=43782 RepID=A0AAE0AW41_9ROSI|nr:hypothetical protein Dsin_004559 [Dipteronia sinensis]
MEVELSEMDLTEIEPISKLTKSLAPALPLTHTLTRNTPLIPEKVALPSDVDDQQKSDDHLLLAIKEVKCIANIALPMVLIGLLLYSCSMISLLFLGRLGELALAGGSLAIGFANIIGYSLLSGLRYSGSSLQTNGFHGTKNASWMMSLIKPQWR